jgi:CNT family concentrative nucleoside transporter
MIIEHFLRGLLGCGVLIALLYALSADRKNIPWKLVATGLFMQLLFALAILKIDFVATIFDTISSFFVVVLQFTKQGSDFVFGGLLNFEKVGFVFAFQILPTIIFFSALTSLLFYLGILQKIVYALSLVMKKFLNISGAENLSATANIFLGQTEAPLLIKPYLEKMTRSELLCVMVGGMATVAGGVMAAYVGFLGGDDPVKQLFYAKHLLAASVMSAPAAIVSAKILLPQTEEVDTHLEITKEKIGANAIEAIANGAEDGLKLAFNVAAMLIVFIAMIAMANYIFSDMIGSWTGLNEWVKESSGGQYQTFTLQYILGKICAPFAWLLGVDSADMTIAGQLLGEKTILNEFVAYTSLGQLKNSGAITNERSIVMITYMLCGFANFASIGIQVGGIGSLIPAKRPILAQLGVKALIGGTVAALFTGVIVGMIL